jgi:hypothetical protein
VSRSNDKKSGETGSPDFLCKLSVITEERLCAQ